MNQTQLILTGAITATAGPVLVVAVAYVRHVVGSRRPAAVTTAGVMSTGYRYCPQELRTRACIVHTDGTARCLDCGTHIPEAVQ